MTKKTLTAADRLEKALNDLDANKRAAADLATEQAPALEKLAELQTQLDALPQHERRKVLDAAGLRHVSAAPRPTTPVRGGGPFTRPTRKAAKAPNWREWQHIPEVSLWQACALSLNLDPHSMQQVPYWGVAPINPHFDSTSFPNSDIEETFQLRLRVLSANLHNQQFFSHGSVSMGHPSLHAVKLAEFAVWAGSVDWEGLPPELVALAPKAQALSAPPPALTPGKLSMNENDPKGDAEHVVGWYDSLLKADKFFAMPSVVPKDAAMLLCGQDPLAFAPTPESTTIDGVLPDDYRLLLAFFQSAANSDSKPRNLKQWVTIAQEHGLKYHPWIDNYERSSGLIAEAGRGQGVPVDGQGVSKREILSVDWPMPIRGAPPLKNILNDMPRWVDGACLKVGRPGKGASGSHLWNPAMLAFCLIERTPQKNWVVGKGALDKFLRANFPDYVDQWERISGDY